MNGQSLSLWFRLHATHASPVVHGNRFVDGSSFHKSCFSLHGVCDVAKLMEIVFGGMDAMLV